MSNFNASASKTEPLNLTRRVNPLEALREVFAPCVDLNYARFARSGLPKEVLSPVLGLRVPLLRSIANRIEKSEIEGTIATLLPRAPKRSRSGSSSLFSLADSAYRSRQSFPSFERSYPSSTRGWSATSSPRSSNLFQKRRSSFGVSSGTYATKARRT